MFLQRVNLFNVSHNQELSCFAAGPGLSSISAGQAVSGNAEGSAVSRFADRLVGLVVKACASRAEDSGFESRLRRSFPGSSHTGDLKFGTPVAILPGAWRYRVRAGTDWPGVSML